MEPSFYRDCNDSAIGCPGLTRSRSQPKMIRMNTNAKMIRAYDPNNLDNLIRFRDEIEENNFVGCGIPLRWLLAYKGLPNYNLGKNLYIVEKIGIIRGYVHILAEDYIKRCVISYLVHPTDRTDELSKSLIDRSFQRTQELELKRVHLFISEEQVLEKQFLEIMGFKHIRSLYELNLDLQKARMPNTKNTHFSCRSFKTGQEKALTRIQNRSFTGTWGFNPNTVAEITYRTQLSDCQPEGIFIAWDGDRPIAYCWTQIYPGRKNRQIRTIGCIHMLGVDPDYRGCGLAKQVFTAGLHYLIKQGIKIAQVSVDSENMAALALYKSAGFATEKITLWFEKKI